MRYEKVFACRFVAEGGITKKAISTLAPVCALSTRRSTPFVRQLTDKFDKATHAGWDLLPVAKHLSGISIELDRICILSNLQ